MDHIKNTRVCSSRPAISIEFNDVDSNNLAGYEERTRILSMILIGNRERGVGLSPGHCIQPPSPFFNFRGWTVMSIIGKREGG